MLVSICRVFLVDLKNQRTGNDDTNLEGAKELSVT
ncbi:hypothetical protein GCW_04030 [Mycoplasmoides gallisepticum S6]|uniref:Uncharacterized protein n=1 Tax=Mycoplasmoides gallisepticum S6 TaxID=1006581 RepID=A0A0F6CLR5_MYCGL|nr:hypothetical protein GCW_04030 [Mycoplasmoides gallisepticum S6]